LQTQQDINFSFVHNLLFSFIDSILFSPLRNLGLTTAADPIDIEREAVLTEPLCPHILHRHTDLRRLHLVDPATHRADLMTVAGVIVTGLVLRRTLKTVTNHQAQFHKQIQGIIHRGPAHVEIHFIQEFIIQFLQREMATDTIDSPQNSVTLQGLAMIVHLKIIIQDALYSVDDTLLARYGHSKNCRFLENRTKVHIFKETEDTLFIKNLN
jgi:hypothetical protein